MPEFQLTEFVLLRSSFETWPGGAPAEEADQEQPFAYPEGDFLDLGASTTRDGEDLILFLRARLDDKQLPFRLEAVVGARFTVEADSKLTAAEAEPTLVWLCYPYLRELIGSITARSPLPPYFVPLLGKLPHPTALEPATQESSSGKQD